MEFGRIYKIVSKSTDKIYIGSTIKTLEERLEIHEKEYVQWFNSDFKSYYCTSFEILKYGDYKIELLEECSYSYRNELLKIEGYYQLQNYYNCVNSCICIKRERKSNIDANEFYTCYCGRQMKNKWKTRFHHVKTFLHKYIVKENHLDMIKTNPKFEISIIE